MMDETNAGTVAAAFAGAATLILVALWRNQEREKNLPPLAPSSVFEVVRAVMNDDLVLLFSESVSKVGYTFRLRLMPLPPYPIVVGDPDLTRDILMDSTTVKSATILKPGEAGFGPGIFSQVDHSIWKPIRKGVAPAFSARNVDRMNQVCQKQAKEWMRDFMDAMAQKEAAFEPGQELLQMTVRVICEAAFEYHPEPEDVTRFLEELELFLREFMLSQSINPVRRFFPFFFPEVKRAHQAIDWMKDFAMKILEHHRSNPNSNPETVIARIAANPNYPDDNARIADIFVFLTAGHDSTGYTVVWTLLELAKNQEEQQKLREALLKVPESERINDLALHNVVRESMRLNPVTAAVSIRETRRKFVSKDGKVVIPSGNIVFLPQVLVNRNPNVFERPDEFWPGRWEKSFMNESAFNPFGLGVRNCVGQALGKSEVYTLTALLISNYRFTLVDEGQPKNFLTYQPKGASLRVHQI